MKPPTRVRPDDLAGPDDPYITIREKDLRDAWLRLDAVGDPRTAHTLWQHLLGVTLTGVRSEVDPFTFAGDKPTGDHDDH